MRGLYELHNAGHPAQLQLGGVELLGFSISGLATYVMVPVMDACFDLGHCPVEAAGMRNVLLSHVHQDHASAVARHLSLRAMTGQRPSRVYVPAESAEALRELLRAYERLDSSHARTSGEGAVIPVEAGVRIRLSGRHALEPFDVVHRIASRGYTVIESRRKLRPEYAGLPGPEIGAAVAAGEQVHDTIEYPLLTYIGDSTIETLRRQPHIGKSEILLLEATFLGPHDHEAAARYGHTHLDEIVALWHEQPETLAARHIILKHFSMRYRRDEITAAITTLPPALRERVHLLLP